MGYLDQSDVGMKNPLYPKSVSSANLAYRDSKKEIPFGNMIRPKSPLSERPTGSPTNRDATKQRKGNQSEDEVYPAPKRLFVCCLIPFA